MPLSDLPAALEDAAGSYYESEMDRWEETKDLGPAGTFRRGFLFGLTGPAPSVQPNPDDPFAPEIDRGPEPFAKANDTAEQVVVDFTGAAPLGDTLGTDDGLGTGFKALLALAAASIMAYTFGQLIDIQI